ncbi:MAG: hypothetical protein Q9222_004848 [Ikaeria aurantiellina]
MVIPEFQLVAPSSDSRKEEVMYPPQREEFDCFPPAVKRKRPVSSHTCTTSTALSNSPGTTTKSSRPTLRSRNSSYFRNPASRLAKKTLPADHFSFEDAQLFRRLPDKVQKKQFTKEEQQALAGRRRSLILDAADEVVLRAGRQRFRSVPTIQTSYTSSSASSVHTLEDEAPIDSAVDMDESILNTFRWMDDDNDLDLTLDDYHNHLASSAEPTSTTNSRRPSFRRALSLTALPCGDAHQPTSADRDIHPSVIPPSLPCESGQRATSKSRTHHHDAITSSIPKQTAARNTDQSAKHYQDPEARLKLRVYLASPSKFDEALEFGFPSLESAENLPLPSRPSLSRHPHTEPALQTFYDSDNPSFLDSFDSESDDAESLPETDIPNTPSDAMFFRNPHRLPASKPTSSDHERPFSKAGVKYPGKSLEPAHPQHHPYAVAGCNREMTLRMTLTRPDLRASEDLLYASSDNDPLALEQLPPTTAKHDLWEQRRDSRGTVKKLWRRVSGR